MKKVMTIFASLVLAAWLLPVAFGQSQPPQPQDPTTQQPSTTPQSTPPTLPQADQKPQQPDPSTQPSQSPSAQPTPQSQQPDSSATSTGSTAETKTFMGTVVKAQDGYMLRAADLQYKLDDQDRARQFDGKSVKVQGTLDSQSNTIHVQTIEASPSM